MIGFSFSRPYAGIEIYPDRIRAVLVARDRKGLTIKSIRDETLNPGIVKSGFAALNIIDPNGFRDALKSSFAHIKQKKTAVVLPDASVKILIRKFPEIPQETEQIHDMIAWNISASLHLSPEELRVSWQHMGVNNDHQHVFLVALSLESVILQFEDAFSSIGVAPSMVLPSGIGQLNFYCSSLPEKGNIAYLGLFDESLNMFVFSNGVPVFHKTVKKGLLDTESDSAVNDVDLLIQYFNTENPDLDIDQFFVASHIKSDLMLQHILQDVSNVGSHITPDMVIEHSLQHGNGLDLSILDERELVFFDNRLKDSFKRTPLPMFSAVIGAVKGILG